MKVSFDIPYIKLTFCTQIINDVKMPCSKVSALRGGMGEMLLRQNCVGDRNCGLCRFNQSCVVMHTFYSYMPKKPSYVTGKESVGYLIECNDRKEEYPAGSDFKFYLILFGESIAFLTCFFRRLLILVWRG